MLQQHDSIGTPPGTFSMAPQSGTFWHCHHAVVLCFVLLIVAPHHPGSDAWVPPASPPTHSHCFGYFSRTPILENSSTHKRTTVLAALPEGYQEFGERLIRQAGSQCGIQKDDDLTIEWKADRIVVTVHGQSYVSAEDKDDDDEDIVYDDDEEEEIENEEIGADDDEREKEDEEEDYSLVDEMNSEDSADEEEKDVVAPSPMSPRGVDVTALARAINAALDDGGIGFAIAELHEIEVTTPGASDELKGPVMFEAYRGFEVICQQQDPKTKKVKQIEGRLVGRDKEFTTINIKGRMKKMKNSTVLSVKLPKAKKEKGVS